MTSYPNSGDRPGGIGENVEDLGRTGSTQDLPSAGEPVPPSSSNELGGVYPEGERAGVGAYEEPASSGYAGSTAEGPWASGTGGPAGSDSKKDVAKSEAADVKDTALEAGSNVAGTAKEEAGNVVREASYQARSLLDQLRSDVREQGIGQKDKIASTLHSLSHELGSMASKSDEDGPVTDLARQASRRGGEIAHWLDDHEPGDALEEVKRYARRHPFTFLAICAAAGVVVGRLGRGTIAANTSLDSPDSSSADRALGSARYGGEQVAPGPYLASAGRYGTAADPYAPGTSGAAQTWPPEQGYGQAPAGYLAPGDTTDPTRSTGMLNGPGDSYDDGATVPVPGEPGRPQGEYRP